MLQADGDDDGIQREIGGDERDGDADRLLEAFQKDAAQDGNEEERDGDLVPFQEGRRNGFSRTCAVASAAERVMVTMKSVATKPRSTRTKNLPSTKVAGARAWQSSLRRGGSRGDAPIDGSAPRASAAPESRWRLARGARGKGGDARLIAERREVIDPRQAHHLPPGMRMVRVRVLVGPFHLLRLILQHGVVDPCIRRRGWCCATPGPASQGRAVAAAFSRWEGWKKPSPAAAAPLFSREPRLWRKTSYAGPPHRDRRSCPGDPSAVREEHATLIVMRSARVLGAACADRPSSTKALTASTMFDVHLVEGTRSGS